LTNGAFSTIIKGKARDFETRRAPRPDDTTLFEKNEKRLGI